MIKNNGTNTICSSIYVVMEGHNPFLRPSSTIEKIFLVAFISLCMPSYILFARDFPEHNKDATQYKYWPAYNKVPVSEIRAQVWRDQDDVIEGWDWSLPPKVEVLPNSLLCFSRDIDKLEKVNFKANPVVSLWLGWAHLEPEEGKYRFDLLKEMIEKATKAGYSVVIRPITGAYNCLDPKTGKDKKAGGKWYFAPRKWYFAPGYLVEKYKVPQIAEKAKKNLQMINLDVTHLKYHERYLAFVKALGESGIPQMTELKGAVVGYKSASWGDEGIGPNGEELVMNEAQHVKERLDAWATAFKGVEHKVCMGGASQYGFDKGFGVRGGFVEMYLYQIPSVALGQGLDEQGYLYTDEEAPLIKKNAFSGDENEEYDEQWTYRFGMLESFSYRYFTATLRTIQMRRNYILNNSFSVYPEMTAWASLEMGHTVETAPDVWCFLRESYIRTTEWPGYAKDPGRAVKNFERWLYQREDKEAGTQTTVAMKMDHAIRMWNVAGNMKTGEGKYYDYIARKGKNIGFAIDDRFLSGSSRRLAVKVTYLDEGKGNLILDYSKDRAKSVPLKNTGKLLTATFFLDDAVFEAKELKHDFNLKGDESEITVSFVRVIKVD